MLKTSPVAGLATGKTVRNSWNVISMKVPRYRSEDALTLTIAVLLVGVVAIGIITGKIAECSGPDVGKRFLEVTPDYTADGLRNWVMRYPSQARRYAFPVLFPLDLLLLITVVGFLAVAGDGPCAPLDSGMALDCHNFSCSLCRVRFH